jgi:hypothetical protein
MEIDAARAGELFATLPAARQAPGLDPAYILADARRSGELNPVFWCHVEDDRVYLHGAHRAWVPGTDLHDFQSQYGYGGPVASSDEPGFLERAQRAYEQWCRENAILAEFVRFHPLVENWTCFAGDVIEDRQTVWIDLTLPDLLASYQVRARTAVRKAIKSGLEVEWLAGTEFMVVFPTLYRGAMRAVGATDFYYFSDDYFAAAASLKTGHFALCRLQNRVVSGAIFLVSGDIMEYHLSASDEAGKRLGATNLLLHDAALRGGGMGCTRLHLGGGTDASPDNPLFFFKAGFSSRRASFKIGKRVYLPQAYARLKAEWRVQHGEPGNRILFYRG